jgi:hypothetical protein
MEQKVTDLQAVWCEAHRGYPVLTIGDRVIVRFNAGAFALGTVIPVPGQAATPGDKPRRGGGVWLRLDDGREWVTSTRLLEGHIRSLGKGGAA